MDLFDLVLREVRVGNLQAYIDLRDLCHSVIETDTKKAVEYLVKLAAKIDSTIANHRWRDDEVAELYKLHRNVLHMAAPHHLDSYMQFLEWNRPPHEQFYRPRRFIMRQLVDALQALVDDELDELFLSMPPRVGKTSMLMFFVTWLVARDSEKSNLYSAYSDTITKAFYQGVLEVINDPDTYLWHEVFPTAKVVQTNSQEETLNVDRRKRYPSLTCRSLYGTLNGACDCSGIEISDDLIGGIEEAMNKDRLRAAWSKVDNNLLPRAKEKAKILWCGTRWSIADPIGVRLSILESEPKFKSRRWKVINLPALDGNDESNFDYEYDVGFSSEFYQQRRASFEHNNDMASWSAQYMGQPIEREGTLFEAADMRYYNGELPDTEPDRIFMAVDPAYGGGDFVAAPLCVQYGSDIYVHDVVFNNGDKRVTQPLLAHMAMKYGAKAMEIEATKATQAYKEGVEQLLKEVGYRINMTTKVAPNNKSKEQRIFDVAPEIRDNMIFRDSGCRSKEYNLFMQNVFGFKMFGKNKNDDAPDSLAMAINMAFRGDSRPEIFKRPF